MRQTQLIVITLALSLAITGCAGIVGPTAQEMTLQARNGELSTQISDLRQTATVEMDRMMITVEHAATEVRSVGFQRDALRATMIARGTDSGFIDVTMPQQGATGLPPGIDSASLVGTPIPGGAAPQVTPAGANAGVPPSGATIDPAQVAAAETPAPQTGARLTDPTLATGVNDNDCAINNITSFDTTAPAIYIVATALDFPSGTVMTARWSREGEVMGTYDIPFNFDINGACVWAFIDQTDFTFQPGNWTVELLINQNPAVGPIPFTITGNAPADNTMEGEGG